MGGNSLTKSASVPRSTVTYLARGSAPRARPQIERCALQFSAFYGRKLQADDKVSAYGNKVGMTVTLHAHLAAVCGGSICRVDDRESRCIRGTTAVKRSWWTSAGTLSWYRQDLDGIKILESRYSRTSGKMCNWQQAEAVSKLSSSV